MRNRTAVLVGLFLVVAGAAYGGELPLRSGSRVGYVAKEDFLTGIRTVRGANTSVTGTIEWNDEKKVLTLPATIRIDAARFVTDVKARDKKVVELLRAKAHPQIVFTLTESAPALAAPLPASAILKGTLEVGGVTKDLEIPVTIVSTSGSIEVDGSVDVPYAAFDVKVPRVPMIAKAHDTLALELHLVLEAPPSP